MTDLILLLFIIIALSYFYFYEKIEKRKDYKSKKVIGDIGESVVGKELNKLDDRFQVYHDVYYGKAQIDYIVHCPSCKTIFVIEVKKWSGIITGKYNEAQWQQNKNGNIKYMNNPILQNRYHCKKVQEVYPRYDVINIVVFVGSKSYPYYKNVIALSDLLHYIDDQCESKSRQPIGYRIGL